MVVGPADGGGDAVVDVVLYGREPVGGGGDRPIGREAGRPAERQHFGVTRYEHGVIANHGSAVFT